jgi:hypothetical protein
MPRTAVATTADRMLDVVAVGSQGVGDPLGSVMLLERRLGVRVDAVRELEDLAASGFDGLGDARPRGRHAAARAGRR